MGKIYAMAKEFRKKYPKTIAFRLDKHSKVLKEHLSEGETISYVFCGQKNENSYMINSSCVIAITNKRLIIGQKRLLWGYFFTSVTPDLYNDLKVIKNLIWSDINIDTVSEKVYISNLDPKGAIEIQKNVSEFMMKEKKKYAKNNN